MSRLICIEGGEGVGKTTFITQLQKSIAANSRSLLLTRQPGGTDLSEKVRKIFLTSDDLSPLSELFLLLADRRQHLLEIIKPALDNKQLILCDRYHLSSRVYQGELGGLSSDVISQAIESLYLDVGHKYRPHLHILLDCDVSVSQQRLMEREKSVGGEITRFDQKSLDYHQKIRQAYLKLIQQTDNHLVLDASQDLSANVAKATQRIEQLLQ